MAKRTFKSKFYNCSYYAYAPVSKVPDDTMISCTIYGDIKKDDVEQWKNAFGLVLWSENEERKLQYNCFSVKGYIPKGKLAEAKEKLKEKEFQIHHDRYTYMHFEIPGGYLYSGWKSGRKTKIKPEDLPDSYVYLCNYKKEGYLETAGVVDVEYKPCIFHNHSYKDDFLFISYTKELPYLESGKSSDDVFNACDEYIFGNDILVAIRGIERNNQDNKELQTKIQKIKSAMVDQYNAFVDEMNLTYNRGLKHVNDIAELPQ